VDRVIFTTDSQIYGRSLRVHKAKILRGDLLREEQEGLWCLYWLAAVNCTYFIILNMPSSGSWISGPRRPNRSPSAIVVGGRENGMSQMGVSAECLIVTGYIGMVGWRNDACNDDMKFVLITMTPVDARDD
jgi:hypothetical protein